MNNPILLTIAICEVGFWVLVIGGLCLRYVARMRRASTIVLALLPVLDLVLVAAVALDLHYLVTASGNGGVLEDQCALGQAALALASTPVLTSQVLRDAVTAHGSELAGWPDAAVVVGVDDRVAVTPEHLSVEKLSRLRDVPGRRRVPSLTYVAEVVLT